MVLRYCLYAMKFKTTDRLSKVQPGVKAVKTILGYQRCTSRKSAFRVLLLVRGVMACKIETCCKIFAVTVRVALESLNNSMRSFGKRGPIFLNAFEHMIKLGVMRVLVLTSENSLESRSTE